MMSPLVLLAIQETPAIIDAFRALFHKQQPSVPPPTNEEVIAAFNHAFASSLAQDAAWMAAHPAP